MTPTKSSRDIVIDPAGVKPTWETTLPSRMIAIMKGTERDWLTSTSTSQALAAELPVLRSHRRVTCVPKPSSAHARISRRTSSTNDWAFAGGVRAVHEVLGALRRRELPVRTAALRNVNAPGDLPPA